MIGYLLEQELRRHLPRERLLTMLTQVVVDQHDKAFGRSTKFVGPVYAEADARRLAKERGWTIAPDGSAWRRVVPSPEPKAIVEIELIRTLVNDCVTVICAGGGGIPVVETCDGGLRGVDAVIDKDLSASLLGRSLGADALVLLTDVPNVYAGWGTVAERPIASTMSPKSSSAPMAPKDPPASTNRQMASAFGPIEPAGSSMLRSSATVVAGRAGTRVSGHPRTFE